jgi:transcriptional regulator with XRE-family HTH domain
MYRTAEEWERYLGRQIQVLRLRMNMRQQELADRAGVGVITVSRLEGGKGSSLSTVIKVLRVLRQEPWLEQLAPETSISPVQVHRLGKPRQRARDTPTG